MFAVLTLDFSIVVAGVYMASVPAKMSVWAAIPLGIVLGLVALSLCFLEGQTVTEITASGFILLVLLMLLAPVGVRARQRSAPKAGAAKATTDPARNAPDKLVLSYSSS